jgi:hypothetical protein
MVSSRALSITVRVDGGEVGITAGLYLGSALFQNPAASTGSVK